jgi:hypothetical protein
MGLEYAVLLHCLKKRFDNCMDEYVKGLSGLEAEKLIDLASEIIAIKETHYEMCFWLEMSMCKTAWPNGIIDEPINQRDVITLLSLDNPLKDLGLKWWFYTLGNKVDFYIFYSKRGDE